MSKGRQRQFRTEDGDVIVLKRWSISKFYAMIDTLGEVGDEIGQVAVSVLPRYKGDEKPSEAEILAAYIKIAATVALQFEKKVTFMIEQSVMTKPDDFQFGDMMPEEYLELVRWIIEMNITERVVGNAKSLFGSLKATSLTPAVT